MKTIGTTLWNSPNPFANNESGFTGLPGGYRYDSGSFYNVGNNGVWWSASENTFFLLPALAWYHGLNYLDGSLDREYAYKFGGLSVRCLRD
jgi:uncharacterized protein (TIGR02145 family)